MSAKCWFGLAVLIFLLAPVRAEKPNLSPEALRTTATHVIVGDVKAIYERMETTDSWKIIHYVAEVQVGECEKGDGIKPGDLVYVRYWRQKWQGRGSPPPGTSVHRGLPEVGELSRIYAARNAYDGFGDTNDGGWNVIGANGFERVKAAPKK